MHLVPLWFCFNELLTFPILSSCLVLLLGVHLELATIQLTSFDRLLEAKTLAVRSPHVIVSLSQLILIVIE